MRNDLRVLVYKGSSGDIAWRVTASSLRTRRGRPPVHRVDVKLHDTSGQPPSQFVVADFLTTAVVRKERIADKSDNRMLILAHGILPLGDQQAILQSTDAGVDGQLNRRPVAVATAAAGATEYRL